LRNCDKRPTDGRAHKRLDEFAPFHCPPET
jgi:hypothetical protein